MEYEIHDLSLAEDGKQRIAWAARHMPVLGQIAEWKYGDNWQYPRQAAAEDPA